MFLGWCLVNIDRFVIKVYPPPYFHIGSNDTEA